MNRLSRLIVFAALSALSTASYAQFDESGIAAGFFDGSQENTINFSSFHLPPLAVLFENAKATPQVMSLQKAQEIAEAEVAKQKRHIFSYVNGHASYGYGKTDMWGQGESESSYLILKQYQGSEQSYWNVGVSLAVPLEDILDLTASVKRKKLEVDQAIYNKDMAYDQLKLQIAGLFTKITNDLIRLKTASENAAAKLIINDPDNRSYIKKGNDLIIKFTKFKTIELDRTLPTNLGKVTIKNYFKIKQDNLFIKYIRYCHATFTKIAF